MSVLLVDSAVFQAVWDSPGLALVVVGMLAVVFAVAAGVAGVEQMRSTARGHVRSMCKNSLDLC